MTIVFSACNVHLGFSFEKGIQFVEVIMALFFLPFAIVFGFATATFAADPASNQAASTPAPATRIHDSARVMTATLRPGLDSDNAE